MQHRDGTRDADCGSLPRQGARRQRGVPEFDRKGPDAPGAAAEHDSAAWPAAGRGTVRPAGVSRIGSGPAQPDRRAADIGDGRQCAPRIGADDGSAPGPVAAAQRRHSTPGAGRHPGTARPEGRDSRRGERARPGTGRRTAGSAGLETAPEQEDVLVPAELNCRRVPAEVPAGPARPDEGSGPAPAWPHPAAVAPVVACAPGGIQHGDGRRHGRAPPARADATQGIPSPCGPGLQCPVTWRAGNGPGRLPGLGTGICPWSWTAES